MVRVLSSLLLALVLALTSQSMAVARGASAATGQMVLCTGNGPVAVYMDAQGQPTSAPHICPDASLLVPVDTFVVALDAPTSVLLLLALPIAMDGQPHVSPRTKPHSRAPPLHV